MKNLPASQLDIMLVIWDAETTMTRKEIEKVLADKKWKLTTVNTFLNRMTESGFLKCEPHGREYCYSPLIAKDEYLEYEGKSMLKKLYQNSIKTFIAATYNGESMTKKELNELEDYLEELKKKEMGEDVK